MRAASCCASSRKRNGWLKLFRSQATLDHAVREFERAKEYGVTGDVLDARGIAALEPNLSGDFAGAVFLPTPGFVPDPGGLAKAYAGLFGRKGGRFVVGDYRLSALGRPTTGSV